MTDEQIAHELVKQASILYAAKEMLASVNEARSTERARCIAIVLQYTDDCQPGPVRIAARNMAKEMRKD